MAVLIEEARHLACTSAEFVDIFFELVEFFDDVDGDDDVVVFKLEECAGIMEKNVGVENKVFDGHVRSL